MSNFAKNVIIETSIIGTVTVAKLLWRWQKSGKFSVQKTLSSDLIFAGTSILSMYILRVFVSTFNNSVANNLVSACFYFGMTFQLFSPLFSSNKKRKKNE